ncbi:HAD family hydrolase [Kribbella sp. NPDC056345]|uniref:HAD family hydrolase n=1 Tax=Kribbella sp. NPDC056345 TaxID=3345789 RepID=UPI0035D6462B
MGGQSVSEIELGGVAIVGVDLDLTLLDTRAATAHALEVTNVRCGESIDVDDLVARLGPPIRDELLRWVAEERVDDVVRIYRAAFLEEGIAKVTPLPGATGLRAHVHERGGRLVVITSRIQQIAEACLLAAGLEADVVVGGLSGRGKAGAMTANQVDVYIGDHTLDMEGAVVADIPGIGVTTGAHDEAALRQAGAAWVVPSLVEVSEALRRNARHDG